MRYRRRIYEWKQTQRITQYKCAYYVKQQIFKMESEIYVKHFQYMKK